MKTDKKNSIKSSLSRSQIRGLGLIAALITIIPVLEAAPAEQAIQVTTANFELVFEVGKDGRLYQRAVGGGEAKGKPTREDEAYPQSGDGLGRLRNAPANVSLGG